MQFFYLIHFFKSAARTNPEINIQIIGIRNFSNASLTVSIPLIMKIKGANRPVNPKGTHSVIHQITSMPWFLMQFEEIMERRTLF